MKKNKIYYAEFHVAGVQYCELIEVIEDMKVGDMVDFVRDEDNIHDHDAVAIMYKGTHIGYIPRTDTPKFTPFIDMGWNDIFEARISRINRDVHPEAQLHVVAKILKKKK